MRWNLGRQIGGIEYQCLAIGFLAAGRGLFAVRAAKSTARQVCENRCFLLKKFARAVGFLKNPWMKSLITRVHGCHRHGLDLAAKRKHIRRRFALNEKIYP
jgi:hypothetical protein